jgi:hypothetical protein
MKSLKVTTANTQNDNLRSQTFFSFSLTSFEDDLANNDSNLSILNDYFADKNDTVSIFDDHKYAKLRDIFIDLNSKIPSSAAVERLFSTAKRIWTFVRPNIGNKILEEMILLKCNSNAD